MVMRCLGDVPVGREAYFTVSIWACGRFADRRCGETTSTCDRHAAEASVRCFSAGSERFEYEILRAFPETLLAQQTQIFLTFLDHQKVIAGQLPHFAGKAA